MKYVKVIDPKHPMAGEIAEVCYQEVDELEVIFVDNSKDILKPEQCRQIKAAVFLDEVRYFGYLLWRVDLRSLKNAPSHQLKQELSEWIRYFGGYSQDWAELYLFQIGRSIRESQFLLELLKPENQKVYEDEKCLIEIRHPEVRKFDLIDGKWKLERVRFNSPEEAEEIVSRWMGELEGSPR